MMIYRENETGSKLICNLITVLDTHVMVVPLNDL